ncbi:pyruvate/oxaloacetate carboxyltransferase [Microbacterium sp. bgisy207]|uniref:pyruvate/oxaloacetate carboxyltransferase n=1 Tax=Microbacterium sp. bgisy207 TaxID=3413800 RepID=UPI003EBC3218
MTEHSRAAHLSPLGGRRTRGPVRIVDTSLRDGNQSLWGATGITTGMAEAAAVDLGQMNLAAIDFTSSTHLSVGVKFHQENPWERLDRVSAAAPGALLSAITTGMRFMSWEKASEPVMRLALRMLATHGVRRLQIAEPMNDRDATIRVARWAKEEGFTQIVAGVVFTESPVHTDERYLANAAAYEAEPAIDRVYLKDPGGLLTVERVRDLVPLLRGAVRKPLELHSHTTTGAASQLYVTAAALDVDVLHTGLGPLSNGTAQPSLEHLLTNLDAVGIPVDIDRDAAARAAETLWAIARSQGLAAGAPTEFDLGAHVHQVPGGMMGTLTRQLGEIGMADRLPQVLEECVRVRAELGYPIMVTPFSQFVGSQALMNVLAVESGQPRYSRIPDEVVRFVLGHFGVPEGAIDPDIEERVRDLPRAAELDRPVPEPSLEELRRMHSERLGRALSDEDLLLAIVLPHDQLAAMYGAGPAPRWSPTPSVPPPTDLTSFVAAANALPRWRSLRIDVGGTRIALDRPAEEDR